MNQIQALSFNEGAFFFLGIMPIRVARRGNTLIDVAGLLRSDALAAINLLKEENAQRRFFAHGLPEIWLLFALICSTQDLQCYYVPWSKQAQ